MVKTMVMLSPKDIRELRLALDLTGGELAQKIGVTEDTVWRWERGDRHPTYKRMVQLNQLREAHEALTKLREMGKRSKVSR